MNTPTTTIHISTEDERRDKAIEVAQTLLAQALHEHWDKLSAIAEESAGDDSVPTIAASVALKIALSFGKAEVHLDLSYTQKNKEGYCDEVDFRQQKLPLSE